MSGFKVGDRVRIVDPTDDAMVGSPYCYKVPLHNDSHVYKVKVGHVGTIVEDTGGKIGCNLNPVFLHPDDFFAVQLDDNQIGRGGNVFDSPNTLYMYKKQFVHLEEESKVDLSKLKNGDVVSVTAIRNAKQEVEVFVKFGDYYYNLHKGGQMKGYKNLPAGRRALITNLSGLGPYFLMSEEELEGVAKKEASKVEWSKASGAYYTLEDLEDAFILDDAKGVIMIDEDDCPF